MAVVQQPIENGRFKRRPAVVVSSERYNRERPDLILMAITSQLRPSPAVGEVAVVEWQAAGLLKPSVIKPLITTIEATLVIRQLGASSPTIRNRSVRLSRRSSGSGWAGRPTSSSRKGVHGLRRDPDGVHGGVSSLLALDSALSYAEP